MANYEYHIHIIYGIHNWPDKFFIKQKRLMFVCMFCFKIVSGLRLDFREFVV